MSVLGTSKTEDVLLIAALAVAGYVVYQLVQGVKATAGAIGAAGSAAYSGARTVTAPVASALAAAYEAMTFAPAIGVAGNVLFPDGTMTPLSSLPIKQDTLGNVYVNPPPSYTLWQLQPSDAQGNWPAFQITDPAQIGQAPGTAPAQPAVFDSNILFGNFGKQG